MSNEQNLDDILKLLQESVDNLEGGADVSESSEAVSADISTADLQKKLEARYFSEGAVGTHEADGSYELDSDFLAEFARGDDEHEDSLAAVVDVEAADAVEEPEAEEEAEIEVEPEAEEEAEVEEEIDAVDDRAPWEDPEPIFAEVEAADIAEGVSESEYVDEPDGLDGFDELDEIDELDEADDIDDFDELADLAELCELEGCLVAEPPASEEPARVGYSSPVATLERDEAPDAESDSFDGELFEDSVAEENDVIDTQNDFETEVVAEDAEMYDGETDIETNAELTEEAEADGTEPDTEAKPAFDEYASYPKERPMSFKALMMDYGRPDPIPSPRVLEKEAEEALDDEEDTPDVGDILSDFADDTPTEEDRMNTSVRRLMTSLGCEDELERVSAEDIGDMYGQLEEVVGCESASPSAEAVEQRREGYKKGVLISSLKLAACAVMTLLMLLYDTLPIFDVEFFGLADYVLYPGAYVFIGTQLLLICAVCLWSPMWGGIKRLLTVYPNIYSMAVVMVAACVFYDSVFFITGSYKPLETPMFHFLCGALLTGIALYELLMRIRESGAFDLYSADVAKFTLTYDKSKHSIGEKMYSGGFSKDKRVYSPSPVSCPKGFSEAIREDGGFGNRVFSSLILVAVGVGVLFGIILMIAGRSLEEGVVAATSSVMVLLPVSAVAAIALPLSVSALRLKKRGIALTGREKIRKYGAEHALVFSDLHLFKKCESRQVGFVCYEPLQTKSVLAALNILYAHIGGPMGEVFANIPTECQAQSIRVRRITRSGIEAVVDKSHTLVVGDAEFLRRYGIEFSRAQTNERTDKNATLYISLDGRASAKLTATYCVEPLFDMLIERLSAEGIHCVIETYDPMINTAFAARQRKKGRAPISVVHKNAADINRVASNAKKRSDHGILALSSRLKLAEAVVFCSRLCKIEKISGIVIYASIGLGFALVLLLAIFASVPCVMQYMLLLYLLAVAGVLLAVTLWLLPGKGYFSVASLEAEDGEREEKNKRRKERKGK